MERSYLKNYQVLTMFKNVAPSRIRMRRTLVGQHTNHEDTLQYHAGVSEEVRAVECLNAWNVDQFDQETKEKLLRKAQKTSRTS